jgi:hypothetical protein
LHLSSFLLFGLRSIFGKMSSTIRTTHPATALFFLLSLAAEVSVAAATPKYNHGVESYPLICPGNVPPGKNYLSSDYADLLTYCADPGTGTNSYPAAGCLCSFGLDFYDIKGGDATVECTGGDGLQLRYGDLGILGNGAQLFTASDYCQQHCLCPSNPGYPRLDEGGSKIADESYPDLDG